MDRKVEFSWVNVKLVLEDATLTERGACYVVRQVWQVAGGFGMAHEKRMNFFLKTPRLGATRRD